MVDWRIVALSVLPGRRLDVTFADGLRGIVDLSRERWDGALAALTDDAFFAKAALHDGVVTWPGGVELAPDAMYDEVQAAGQSSASSGRP